MPGVRLDGDADAEEAAALRRAREPWVAGFCLFGGDVERVSALTRRLEEAAGRPLLLASDVERGAGQQVRGLSVLPEAAAWGLAATPAEAEAFGEITAREARSVGVNLLFAPVLDVRSEPRNPIVGNRSFGWDPARVGAVGAAFCRGALRGGALSTGKHFPGHGGTTADSHDAVPVVGEEAHRLLARDVAPFLHAVSEGCAAVMTAHVAYPALDPEGSIATFSPRIVGLLRAHAPDALVVTDALLMAGALGAGTETHAARLSLLAACDVLLYPTDPDAVAASLLDERSPSLDAAIEAAVARIESATRRAASLRAPPEAPGLRDVPARVAARSLALQGGDALGRERRSVVVLDDDGVAERGRVLADRGRRAGVSVEVVRSGETPAAARAGTVVVMSSVRAWKGASNLSPAGEALLSSLRGEEGAPPRRVWMTPLAPAGDLHLPSLGPDAEAALADRLFA
jgi:beta-glucosidase-like glycosyl hydrolase